MNHIKGITNLGLERNQSYMVEWCRLIGFYMLNFANVELISYKYLDSLEKTEEAFLKNTEKSLSQRINRIEELIGSLDFPPKAEILQLWCQIRELAKWRNKIAHNPVLLTWKPGSDLENSQPDVLGIPDIKQISKESKISDSISLKNLSLLNDETVRVAARLHEMSQTLNNA
jgi:hypothetical protein